MTYNPKTQPLDAIDPADRRAAQIEKSDRLFNLACRIQDDLERIGIFHGDGTLLAAKKRIYEACEKARETSKRVRYG